MGPSIQPLARRVSRLGLRAISRRRSRRGGFGERTCDGHCRQRIEVGESRPVAGQCSAFAPLPAHADHRLQEGPHERRVRGWKPALRRRMRCAAVAPAHHERRLREEKSRVFMGCHTVSIDAPDAGRADAVRAHCRDSFGRGSFCFQPESPGARPWRAHAAAAWLQPRGPALGQTAVETRPPVESRRATASDDR